MQFRTALVLPCMRSLRASSKSTRPLTKWTSASPGGRDAGDDAARFRRNSRTTPIPPVSDTQSPGANRSPTRSSRTLAGFPAGPKGYRRPRVHAEPAGTGSDPGRRRLLCWRSELGDRVNPGRDWGLGSSGASRDRDLDRAQSASLAVTRNASTARSQARRRSSAQGRPRAELRKLERAALGMRAASARLVAHEHRRHGVRVERRARAAGCRPNATRAVPRGPGRWEAVPLNRRPPRPGSHHSRILVAGLSTSSWVAALSRRGPVSSERSCGQYRSTGGSV